MREASRRPCDVQEASCVNVMCKDAVAADAAASVFVLILLVLLL